MEDLGEGADLLEVGRRQVGGGSPTAPLVGSHAPELWQWAHAAVVARRLRMQNAGVRPHEIKVHALSPRAREGRWAARGVTEKGDGRSCSSPPRRPAWRHSWRRMLLLRCSQRPWRGVAMAMAESGQLQGDHRASAHRRSGSATAVARLPLLERGVAASRLVDATH